uniref:Uncharacterized protein n=1 Tax=Agaricus bisporus TaxID=5341 RepID=A0A1Q1M946_AGABI|nr:hypothetical protein [Agaricus bisporus]
MQALVGTPSLSRMCSGHLLACKPKRGIQVTNTRKQFLAGQFSGLGRAKHATTATRDKYLVSRRSFSTPTPEPGRLREPPSCRNLGFMYLGLIWGQLKGARDPIRPTTLHNRSPHPCPAFLILGITQVSLSLRVFGVRHPSLSYSLLGSRITPGSANLGGYSYWRTGWDLQVLGFR